MVNIVSVANHYENTLTTSDIHIQTSEHAFLLREMEYRKGINGKHVKMPCEDDFVEKTE